MTLTELLQKTFVLQPVHVHIDEEVIVGCAEALDNYLCTEIVESEVEEIKTEENAMKVWVK